MFVAKSNLSPLSQPRRGGMCEGGCRRPRSSHMPSLRDSKKRGFWGDSLLQTCRSYGVKSPGICATFQKVFDLLIITYIPIPQL